MFKAFAMKCIGIILSKTSNKSVIDKQIENMFNNVNHSNGVEKEVKLNALWKFLIFKFKEKLNM
jgi:hypothetical protein